MNLALVVSLLAQSLLSIYNASAANFTISPEDFNRLAHGTTPDVGRFKAVVALVFALDLTNGNNVKSLCTGQIITKHWVMSAVHCFGHHVFYKSFYPGRIISYSIKIIAGVNDYKKDAPSKQVRVAGPSDYHIYPGSLRTSGKIPPVRKIDEYISEVVDKLDIALLFIRDPFEFNKYVGSIALGRNYVQNQIIAPKPCYSVGFGMTKATGESSSLNFIKVKAGGKDYCKELKDDFMDISRGYHICSKGAKKANICAGDSGGPLICGNGKGSLSVGVLSYYSLKVGPKMFFESMKCGQSKRGVATYMYPGHAEKWISRITDTPVFVGFLKKTDYSGASKCSLRWPLVYYLVGIILFSGQFF